MARKARSDSKLDQLDPELRQQIIDKYLHENLGHTAIAKWLDEKKDVSISASSCHAWYQRVVWPQKLEMRKQRATQANALISEALGKEVDWTAALAEEVSNEAYEMLRMGSNKKMALAYARTAFNVKADQNKLKIDQAKLKQGQEKLKHDERRIKLLEEKAAEVKATLQAAVAGARSGAVITEETIAKIEEAASLL